MSSPIIKADLDEMVFAGRERQFGATAVIVELSLGCGGL